MKVQFKCIDYVQRMLIEYWLTVSGTPAVAVTYRLWELHRYSKTHSQRVAKNIEVINGDVKNLKLRTKCKHLESQKKSEHAAQRSRNKGNMWGTDLPSELPSTGQNMSTTTITHGPYLKTHQPDSMRWFINGACPFYLLSYLTSWLSYAPKTMTLSRSYAS
jgi:hypothetical protein